MQDGLVDFRVSPVVPEVVQVVVEVDEALICPALQQRGGYPLGLLPVLIRVSAQTNHTQSHLNQLSCNTTDKTSRWCGLSRA